MFQYNAANQLSALVDSATGATAYTYDAQGNLATKGSQSYSFDYGNRLRAVSGQQTYRYDALGRRVLEVATINGAVIHAMYTQAGQLAYRRDYGTDVTDAYIYLGKQLVAVEDYPFAGGAGTRYQHTDAQGTVVAQTDASRNVLSRSVYASYGQAWTHGNDDGPGYTGHLQDSLTGLTYMQQRYYDPQSKRFLSTDPVQANPNTGASFNRYVYASDNPERWTDPDGRYTCDKDVCAVVEKSVAALKKSESNLQGNLRTLSQYTRVQRVVNYIGSKNDKGGPHYVSGHLKSKAAALSNQKGTTTIDLTKLSGANSAQQGAEEIGHEAQHDVDAQAHGPAGDTNDRKVAAQQFTKSETNAYRTENAIMRGFGQQMDDMQGAIDGSVQGDLTTWDARHQPPPSSSNPL